MPVRLSGQAEVHVARAEDGGEAARVVLEQVLPSALKCSWTLSGKVEMTLKGMEGKAVNLGQNPRQAGRCTESEWLQTCCGQCR